MTYTTEVFRRVYDDTNGTSIQVSPGPDGFGIQVSTAHNKESADYWGELCFCVPKEMAEKLGQALIDAAREATE